MVSQMSLKGPFQPKPFKPGVSELESQVCPKSGCANGASQRDPILTLFYSFFFFLTPSEFNEAAYNHSTRLPTSKCQQGHSGKSRQRHDKRRIKVTAVQENSHPLKRNNRKTTISCWLFLFMVSTGDDFDRHSPYGQHRRTRPCAHCAPWLCLPRVPNLLANQCLPPRLWCIHGSLAQQTSTPKGQHTPGPLWAPGFDMRRRPRQAAFMTAQLFAASSSSSVAFLLFSWSSMYLEGWLPSFWFSPSTELLPAAASRTAAAQGSSCESLLMAAHAVSCSPERHWALELPLHATLSF